MASRLQGQPFFPDECKHNYKTTGFLIIFLRRLFFGGPGKRLTHCDRRYTKTNPTFRYAWMSRHLENDQTESRSVFPGGDGFHDGDYKCQIGACCQSWFVPRDLQKRLLSIIDAHKTDGGPFGCQMRTRLECFIIWMNHEAAATAL